MKTNTATVGRDARSDLVLEHPTVSGEHALVEMAADGQLAVVDADSANGTYLCRNDVLIRIRRVKLCVGDRIRFGEYELGPERLSVLFGGRATLGTRQFPLRAGNQPGGGSVHWDEPAAALQKPRRNAATGKIEEEQA